MTDRLELGERRILYEDQDLLAVDKPTGLVSHATRDPDRDHLVAAVQRWLRARDGDVGHLRQHHRLDVGTSGVVVFSRRVAADGPLSAAFEKRLVLKTYLAVVARPRRPIPPQWTAVRSFLAPGRGPSGETISVRSGGKPAHTDIRSAATVGELVLVEARPRTGRTHQIRVHLAEFGAPILGDELYGHHEPDVKRLMLHAAAIELPHPVGERMLRIEAPPPRAFARRFPQLRDR